MYNVKSSLILQRASPRNAYSTAPHRYSPFVSEVLADIVVPPTNAVSNMSRPFEGKCKNCTLDKQACTFDPQQPEKCTWCARHRYQCSETEPDPRRRKLAAFKCDYCREKHHKCLPENRQWPGQKCNLCEERELPCSAPRSRRPRGLAVARDQSQRGNHGVDVSSQRGHGPTDVNQEPMDNDHVTPAAVLERNDSSSLHDDMLNPHILDYMGLPTGLSLDTKQRLLHFLYAAEQPLTITQLSIIPAINTTSRIFESDKILAIPSEPYAAQCLLSNWFGSCVTFDPGQLTVSFSNEYRQQVQSYKLRPPQWYHQTFKGHFSGPEEAHAETLFVCSTYLLLNNGGSAENEMSGLGFEYSDDNNLYGIMDKIAGQQAMAVDNANVPRFYSLWKYATVNLARHLATVAYCQGFNLLSHSIVFRRFVDLLLSNNFLTWLEHLNYILCGNDVNQTELVGLTFNIVCGLFQRWAGQLSFSSHPADAELFAGALQRLSHSLSISSPERVKTIARARGNSPQLSKLTLCHELQELLSKQDPRMRIPKLDFVYYKYAMSMIEQMSEPCIIDISEKTMFFVYQSAWRLAGALKLECIDLQTGLIVGEQSTWAVKFPKEWQYRILMSKSATHVGIQLVAQRIREITVETLLYTSIYRVRSFNDIDFIHGKGNIEEPWKLDDGRTTISAVQASKSSQDLYRSGHLVFAISNGMMVVETPSGVWDLSTRTKIRDCTQKPTILTASLDGQKEAHVEWDSSAHTCRRLFITMPGQPNQSYELRTFLASFDSPKPYFLRYAAFSYDGTKFLVQVEYPQDSLLHSPQTAWFLWRYKSSYGWELEQEVPCKKDNFLPLLTGDSPPIPGFSEKISWSRSMYNMGPLCSIQRVGPGCPLPSIF